MVNSPESLRYFSIWRKVRESNPHRGDGSCRILSPMPSTIWARPSAIYYV